MYAITTRDLSRSYGKIQAVHHLNLKIPSGSLFGLIGPNGAGKSTTIRMLAGLLEPGEGEIRINELTISALLAGDPMADRIHAGLLRSL